MSRFSWTNLEIELTSRFTVFEAMMSLICPLRSRPSFASLEGLIFYNRPSLVEGASFCRSARESCALCNLGKHSIWLFFSMRIHHYFFNDPLGLNMPS